MKTLKDETPAITSDQPFGTELGKGPYKYYSEEQLKRLAIEWIKELENVSVEVEFIDCNGNKVFLERLSKDIDETIVKNEIESIINWIKHFFNITEEDLK